MTKGPKKPFSQAVTQSRIAELEAALAERDTTIAGLRTDNEILKNDIEELATIACLDPLTKLWTRRKLDADLEELIDGNSHGSRRARDSNFCFAVIDLNKFKRVNDDLGHGAGDKVLEALAKELQRFFKGDQHTLCRAGGDEFYLLLRGMTAEEATKRLSTLDKMLRCDAAGQTIAIHISFGVADYNGQTPAGLKDEADAKQYVYKETLGKDLPTTWKPAEVFDPSKIPAHIMHPLPKSLS